MKNLLLFLLIPALSVSASAQEAFQIPAIMSQPDGANFRAWILASTKTDVRYKTTEISTDFTDAKISSFATIFLIEPPEYSAAVDLFEARKYKEAQAKFAEVKEFHKPMATMNDNFHTLSAFYEMESMRKQGDYEGIAAALGKFIKEPLTRDHQLRQLELYVMWDAVRAEAWDRLIIIASERDAENLPGYQRVQVAYCKGLALEKLKRGREALIEYNIAMTADAGASEEITRDAALNSLGIYRDDEEVQLAITNWGTEDENKSSGGYTRLLEAGALARLYNLTLGTGKALPADLKKLTDYKS